MASKDLPQPGVGPGSDSLSAQARKLIGTEVAGRYKVLSLIGEGGMGAVFLVEHKIIRKRMALKVLNEEMMKNPEAVARFEREALAAAHIDHANVVAATDSGRTDDGALFVVLEYVDGRSLRDRIAVGPLPPALTLHVTRQVISALVRAHGMSIIHRDLKPENIMLVSRDGDDNVVKVLDFGLAKLSVRQLLEGLPRGGTAAGDILTRYGAVFGTPAYMAPEQAAGGEVDGRTDLYAVGVLIYEMLTGVLPFDGDDSAALLRQHVAAAVPPIRSRVPGLKLPPAVEQLVLKLLEKRPDKRFATAKDLLAALDAVVIAEGLKYDPSSPAMKLRPDLSGGKPPTEANLKATVLAPDDLAEQKFGESLPGAQGESLALALKDLGDIAGGDKGRADGPSLDGLAGQFGASAPLTPAGGVPPSLFGKAPGEEGGPPKLKAPSALDIQVLQPEGAALAVLTPAPPPTFKERVRDAGEEAVGWWRAEGWPKTREKSKTAYETSKKYFLKLLDFVRARLPEKQRGISQTVLGLSVGAALTLPLLIFIIVLSRSCGGDSASSSTPNPTAALPGFASDKDMEKSVSGGVRDLEKLAAKYPSDSRVFRALARAQVTRKDYVGAMRALTNLARLDPTMASDDEMGQIAAAAALLPETSDAAITLLETQLGDKGVSVLSDLAERTTMEPWKGKLNASLQKGTVRALASESTLVLMDLRAAQRCEDKRTLLRRASQQGDARTLAYLQALQKPTGCGPGGQNDCWPCMRKGTALQAIIDALSKKLGGG